LTRVNRVSTQRQGVSGLGLDAQKEAVERYIAADKRRHPGPEFREIESGRNSERPKIHEAIAYCKAHRAKLVIAKLDRLARNVLFIAQLMESKVDFAACDLPKANNLTIHIMAAMAQHEAESISNRTKEALAKSKKQLGGKRYLRDWGNKDEKAYLKDKAGKRIRWKLSSVRHLARRASATRRSATRP
jgi:DNA invertase Pin-like site-specific DNA recombinase